MTTPHTSPDTAPEAQQEAALTSAPPTAGHPDTEPASDHPDPSGPDDPDAVTLTRGLGAQAPEGGLAVMVILDGPGIATRSKPHGWDLLTAEQRCAIVDGMKRELLGSSVDFEYDGFERDEIEGGCATALPGEHPDLVALVPDGQLPATAYSVVAPDVLTGLLNANQRIGATLTAAAIDAPVDGVTAVVTLRLGVEFSGDNPGAVLAAASRWQAGAGRGETITSSTWETAYLDEDEERATLTLDVLPGV